MAAAGVSMRTLQEWLGHRDYATTLIYADYQPDTREAELVERASPLVRTPKRTPKGATVSTTQMHSARMKLSNRT
jgi:hypothetical protein